MKKLISAALGTIMTFTAAAPAFAANFSDTGGSYSWAESYIDDMYEAGYITGYEDGTFRPGSEVTRLECIALFARAMGSSDEENEPLLAYAHDEYDTLIKEYDLEWGGDEIAYLLYKGVLDEDDLNTYIRGDEKNKPMRRHEAAVIITKALGAEKDALAVSSVSMSYTDTSSIPPASLKYVNYVTETEIMTGMGNGLFSPSSSVLRAQMAIMLSRTVDAADYSFFTAKLYGLEEVPHTITYIDPDGSEKKAVYNDDTSFRVLGVETQAKIMTTGVRAVFTMSGDELVSVDALSDSPDETVKGTFKGYETNGGTVSVSVFANGETKSYPCAPDVTISYGGAAGTIRSFKDGDTVSLSLSDGKVEFISGNEKDFVLNNAIIEDIIIEDGVKIKISSANDEYDGKILDVDSNVAVKKNNLESDLSKIYVGDTVNLTLQYDIVKRIVASSKKDTITGTISSITIASPASSMTVTSGGETKEYTIPAGVEIKVNGEEGTLYDFTLGDTVKLTTESDAITKIEATSTQVTSGSITGVVTGVSASLGFVNVTDEKGLSMSVYCRDNTTIISATGSNKKIGDIAMGQTLSVRGTMTAGILTASLIIIEAEAPAEKK